VPRRTADDRSREVVLYGLRSDPRRWLRPGGVPVDVQKRIARRARADSRRRLAGPTSRAPFLYISGVVGVIYVYQRLGAGYSRTARVVVCVCVAALTAILIYRSLARQKMTPFIVGAFLAERRCPACGYDLAGAAPADDGCTVCPECGAAWKLALAESGANK